MSYISKSLQTNAATGALLANTKATNCANVKWRKIMVESIVQIVIVGMWAVILAVHTRRLLRLAKVQTLAQWGERRLRPKLDRVWW